MKIAHRSNSKNRITGKAAIIVSPFAPRAFKFKQLASMDLLAQCLPKKTNKAFTLCFRSDTSLFSLPL